MENSPLNLISDPWIPILRQSGLREIIRPAQVVENLRDDPVMAVDWPRADFCHAGLEFLIGLLATAFAPKKHRNWLHLWKNPPTAEELDEAFSFIVEAFFLDGDGPRFLQDQEDLKSDSIPVERLLIDSPSNAGLFVHQGQVPVMARSTAAIALFTLQSWAPAGGRGNLTGLRGGGPMSTFILPGDNPSLWQVLWANVPVHADPLEKSDLPRIFPWLASTVTSETGRKVYPHREGDFEQNCEAHPLQCWWGMPRRIRLDFEPSRQRQCALTGRVEDISVLSWRQRPYGVSYSNWGDQHPLTPRYRQKKNSEKLPIHPQPGGVGYRDWIGLVVNDRGELREPAPVVFLWEDRQKDLSVETRLLAVGYDMDNAKARGYVDSEMPLLSVKDPTLREIFDDFARILVLSAEIVAVNLRARIRSANSDQPTKVKTDVSFLTSVIREFWDRTQDFFFILLNQMSQAAIDVYDKEEKESKERWLFHLRDIALSIFDRVVLIFPDMTQKKTERIMSSRRFLVAVLSGYHRSEGQKLFELLKLPLPEKKKRLAHMAEKS